MKQERFKTLHKSVQDKILIFKAYPGQITYYNLTQGVKSHVESAKSSTVRASYFTVGSIEKHNEHNETIAHYKGFFTDAFDNINPRKPYHHCFTERAYNDILEEYQANGYIESDHMDSFTSELEHIGKDIFDMTDERFIITQHDLSITVSDTLNRVRYKACFLPKTDTK